MNFLREKSLRQICAYILVLMILLFLAQFFIVRHKISQLNRANQKIDFARSIQTASQRLALQLQFFLNGTRELDAEIAALIHYQDYRLNVLSKGGRIDGTDHFITPLTRLPAITFQGLNEVWNDYKQSSFAFIGARADIAENNLPSDSTITDSLAYVNPSTTKTFSNSRVRLEGLAISLGSWYDKLIADLEEEVNHRNAAITQWLIFLVLFNSALLGSFYLLFTRHILSPLKTIAENTAKNKHSFGLPANEIGRVAHPINETIENLKDATDFVTSISKGDLTMDYKEALDKNYVPGVNTLADSLIAMQAKLRELNEEERKRQWTNEGLTKFVDILRASSDNLHVLCDQIIASLVHYTKSNQGALYILNDEDINQKHLELISLFAFDIKKHEQQKIKPGEGILGQTFLEKDTTYLTSVPEEYVRITSGLGGATPKSILIVPLRTNQEVYGLVELASFREFQPHEISFVEKLGESIASTLASVRAAHKNRHLIEQFQQQTEEMRAQEEEMRQNMEELQATQEEIARKEKGYLERIKELEEQTHSGISLEELESVKSEWIKKEQAYSSQLEQMKRELAQQKTQSNDWEIAQELNNALQTNLEMLKIAQEELDRKREV